MKKILKLLTGRLFIICFFIFLQLVILLWGAIAFTNNFIYYYVTMTIIAFFLVVKIVNDDSNPTFKIAWIIPMLLFPIFGAPIYLIFGRKTVNSRIKRRFSQFQNSVRGVLPENKEIIAEIAKQDERVARQFQYVQNTALSPAYKGTSTRYFPSGEAYFEELLIQLERAEKFIFLEYFIIAKGKMWNTILDILKRKAQEGVEIKLMYDDLGTIQLLHKDYPSELEKLGIEVLIFNRFRPSLDAFLNYRDHRKILVVDGNVGFTGGINLADEYINEIERHGHWKDTGVMIEGSAVTRLTTAFLQLWYFSSADKKTALELEYKKYFSTRVCENDGYVQPFYDGPVTGYLTGEMCYMGIINNAKKYIYITTPYLILDNEMITALTAAATSGIDVRIITPHLPDKKSVFMVTRSNYPALLKAGVKIYEYTPGFIHAKAIVADDEIGVVGTTNFDFRSFYLHFENGILMYKSRCVMQAKEDFLETQAISQQIDSDYLAKRNAFNRFFYKVMKIFSPLM